MKVEESESIIFNLYISSADRRTVEAEKSLGQREWVTHKQRRDEGSSFSFLTAH